MSEISFLVAFAAGVLALLSPCSALLLPSFFAYAFASRSAQLLRTFVFYLGLAVTLVPLGMGAGSVSAIFYGHRQTLITVAGWTIIAMGAVHVLGRGATLPFATSLRGIGARVSSKTSGWPSTLVLGAVYGLAGFCSGPVLGAILTLAATRHSWIEGGALLAVYALGMAAPLFGLAALWDRFDLGRRRWLRGTEIRLGPVRVHVSALIAGSLFILIGVLFLRFDGTAGISGMFGLGDSTDLEFAAQERLADWFGAVPAWSLAAAVSFIAAAVASRRHLASRRSARDEARR